jgi:hypothetical protein
MSEKDFIKFCQCSDFFRNTLAFEYKIQALEAKTGAGVSSEMD